MKVVHDTGGDITFTLVRALENAAASRKPRIATLIIATLDTTIAPRVTKLNLLSRPLEMTVYTGDDELANSILTAMKKFARNTSNLIHAMAEAVHAAKHINHAGFQKRLSTDIQDLVIQDTLFQRFIKMSTNVVPEITIVVIIMMFWIYMATVQDLAVQDTIFQRFIKMSTNFLPEITVVVIIIMFLICIFVQSKV